jgi:HAD superfamily hydrolase (TIGR01549 family)
MANLNAIFFDVGNTLLFPNRQKILAPLASECHPTLDQWQALERRTKAEFDREMNSGRVDHGFWQTFHGYLLDNVGETDDRRAELLRQLVRNTQNSANWDQMLPGTREALDRIRSRFRIAVISNSDGGIDRALTQRGLRDCFESVTDSGNVGVEKPRREIFEAALKTTGAKADESLYVGDVYSVDYVGSQNAGMQAVIFDVSGAYRDKPEPRVESLEHLESWLKK